MGKRRRLTVWLFPHLVDVDCQVDECGHGHFRLVAKDPAQEAVIIDLSDFACDVKIETNRVEGPRVTVTLEGIRLRQGDAR